MLYESDYHDRTRSSELFARAQKRIPGGVNSPVRAFRNVGGDPFFVDRAEGARIWDVDGNEYIDYVGSWGPAILGHAPKVVVEAVRDAATRGLSFGIPNPLEVEMAELICRLGSIDRESADGEQRHGSDDVVHPSGARVHRARQDHQVRRLLSRACGFIAGESGQRRADAWPPDSAGVPKAFADLTISLPFNDVEVVAKSVSGKQKRNRGGNSRADSGQRRVFIFREKTFCRSCARNARSNGALLIFDEVMTGFRVARGGAQEIYGMKPDLTAARKSNRRRIAGRRVWRARRNHGPTFAGWPGVSGGNVVRQSAGDGRRSRAIARTRADQRLEIAREIWARNLKR